MLRETGKLRELPNEAAANVKDRLRDLRDFLRARRHDRIAGHSRQGPAGQIGELLGHAVSVVDDTLTFAESVSSGLLPLRDSSNPGPRPLPVYFPGGEAASWRGERAFRHDMYAAAKRASSAFGLETDSLRESAFSTAHAAARRRHAMLLARLHDASAERLESVADLAAALMLELKHALESEGQETRSQTFVRRYVPGLLGSALATLDLQTASEAEFFELLLLATEAREERLMNSLSDSDPDALAEVISRLLAHLA
ncbi:hypothetical protein [Chelativorans sp.]|uniref:hypothetical protein n=1 Tax=Chelativorans sp. TaxID=2203393 RepID=UPI00281256AA|nr:hypothetical protein [Chelativorans sp.]